jgi:transposase
LGNRLGFILTRGEQHEAKFAKALLARHLDCKMVIADRGYDSDDIRQFLADHGIEAVIPPKRNRKTDIPYDRHMYKERHKNENFFGRIKKKFRRVATRYDKTAIAYAGAICIAAIYDWIKSIYGF